MYHITKFLLFLLFSCRLALQLQFVGNFISCFFSHFIQLVTCPGQVDIRLLLKKMASNNDNFTGFVAICGIGVTELVDALDIGTQNPAKKVRFYKTFDSLKTNTEKFNFVYNNFKKRYHHDNKRRPDNRKNDDSAVMFRECGNKHFRSGNYPKALEDYTRSIASALSEVLLALAYANRSACLYKLGMFSECLIDIERALKNNYPDKLKPKLMVRRESAEKLRQPKVKFYEEIPEIADSKRTSAFACASKSVRLDSGVITAARDIQTGEVICVEKPLLCVVRSTDYLVHCHECLELCYVQIPCNSCTKALFCSESCKEKAQVYHKFECLFLDMLQEWNNPKLQFAIRLAILTKNDKKILNNWQITQNLSIDAHLFVPLTLLVVSVFHILKTNTDFFENEKAEDNFKEIVLARVQSITYTFQIHEYAKGERSYVRNYFANGIYFFAATMHHLLFNLSPNIERTFYGSTIVLRAAAPIAKGQMCFFNDLYSCFPNDTCSTCVPPCVQTSREILIWKYVSLFKDGFVEDPDLVAKKLLAADVQFARKILPQLVELLKHVRNMCFPFPYETSNHFIVLKEIVSHCFDTLGNKKRM